MKKKNRILLIFIIILLPLIGSIVFYDKIFLNVDYSLKEVDEDNSSGIENLKLKGEVINSQKRFNRSFHGMGILKVNIINSNFKNYDPREYQANYYCIIKNSIAEIYVKGVSDIRKEDTVYIDISKKEARVYNSKRKFKRNLSYMIYPRSFFDYIKHNGYQKI